MGWCSLLAVSHGMVSFLHVHSLRDRETIHGCWELLGTRNALEAASGVCMCPFQQELMATPILPSIWTLEIFL